MRDSPDTLSTDDVDLVVAPLRGGCNPACQHICRTVAHACGSRRVFRTNTDGTRLARGEAHAPDTGRPTRATEPEDESVSKVREAT